jgi:hypothetical protein
MTQQIKEARAIACDRSPPTGEQGFGATLTDDINCSGKAAEAEKVRRSALSRPA